MDQEKNLTVVEYLNHISFSEICDKKCKLKTANIEIMLGAYQAAYKTCSILHINEPCSLSAIECMVNSLLLSENYLDAEMLIINSFENCKIRGNYNLIKSLTVIYLHKKSYDELDRLFELIVNSNHNLLWDFYLKNNEEIITKGDIIDDSRDSDTYSTLETTSSLENEDNPFTHTNILPENDQLQNENLEVYSIINLENDETFIKDSRIETNESEIHMIDLVNISSDNPNMLTEANHNISLDDQVFDPKSDDLCVCSTWNYLSPYFQCLLETEIAYEHESSKSITLKISHSNKNLSFPSSSIEILEINRTTTGFKMNESSANSSEHDTNNDTYNDFPHPINETATASQEIPLPLLSAKEMQARRVADRFIFICFLYFFNH